MSNFGPDVSFITDNLALIAFVAGFMVDHFIGWILK